LNELMFNDRNRLMQKTIKAGLASLIDFFALPVKLSDEVGVLFPSVDSFALFTESVGDFGVGFACD